MQKPKPQNLKVLRMGQNCFQVKCRLCLCCGSRKFTSTTTWQVENFKMGKLISFFANVIPLLHLLELAAV
ncbi:hypothetical protein FCV25MIE_33479, partial [Fagus crenata]